MFKDNKWYFLQILGVIIFLIVLALIVAGGQFSFFGSNGLTPDWTNIFGEGNVNSGFRKAPDFTLQYTKDYRAKIETNLGTLEVDLLERGAPKTVNNFVFLAEKTYYNGTSFHRLIKDLLIQGGDRNTLNKNANDDGFGDPGYQIDDEINWDKLTLTAEQKQVLTDEGYKSTATILSENLGKYMLAMANEGKPNTNGSQFFIVFKDSEEVNKLNGRHTVFGKIIGGFDVLEKMNNAQVDTTDPNNPKPKDKITINNVTVEIIQ